MLEQQIKALLHAACLFQQAHSLSLSALLISLTLCNCSDSGSINKLKAQCLLLLLAFFICRWRAVVDDDCAVADAAALLTVFFLFFALPHLLHVLVHYVCSTLHSAASSVKRLETRTLVALSLSLSFAALPLSRSSCALWLIAYGWRRRSRRTYLLFVVVMICDFHAAAAAPRSSRALFLTIDGRTVAAAGRNYATCWNFTRLA